MEGLALTGAWVDKQAGLLSLIVLEMGGSSRLCMSLQPGEPVVVMGPTGTPTETPAGESVVLAGGGDLREGFRAAARPGGERVLFPGPVLRDTLPDLYRAADLFVLPAVHDGKGNVDGLPNVILEAMASGLPVVASGISGIPLAVEDGRTGRLVPEGDREALFGALRGLLADPAGARAMGERGRRKAEAELTWDAVAARYREGYRMALGLDREPGGALPVPV